MPRPARRYSKRIEVWNYTANYNGFGGNDTTDTQLGSAWAEIRTIPTNKQAEFGQDITKDSITIYVRKRSDIDYTDDTIFFKYKGKDYVPFSVTEKDLDGVEYEILCNGRD